MDNKQKIIIIAALILILAGAGVWYWYSRPKAVKTTEDAIEAVTSATGLDIQSNPVEGKVPDVNPINKTNPFKILIRTRLQGKYELR